MRVGRGAEGSQESDRTILSSTIIEQATAGSIAAQKRGTHSQSPPERGRGKGSSNPFNLAPSNTAECFVMDMGVVDYGVAWEQQKRLHSLVVEGKLPGVLVLMEHPHVYTLGRRGGQDDVLASEDELMRLGAEVHHVDRGGMATYHGPGQLVGYPIVSLRDLGIGPLEYVCGLQEVIVATLSDFGIAATCDGRPTGVWVGESKIAAIGVKVGRGVTTHGFALNVDPDLSFFEHIVPCGMPDARVTSMFEQLQETVSLESVMPVITEHFGRVLGLRTRWGELEEVVPGVGLSEARPSP